MTPPDTNLTTQRRRHRPALYAIAFALIFGLLTVIVRVFVATDTSDAPMGAEPTVGTPMDAEETTPQQTPPRLPGQ